MMETNDNNTDALVAENDELKAQLEQYQMLAKGNERRILDLHNDLAKKDDEIAKLKKQLSSSTGVRSILKDSQSGRTADDTVTAPVEGNDGVDEVVLRKLFIGGLNHATTTESLREHFSAFGEICDCIVMKDATGKSRGFGFVVYTTRNAIDAAQAARPHEVDGRSVETRRAVPRGENTSRKAPAATTRRVFIGGLKVTTDEETVREYFSQYGEIEMIDLPADKTSKRRRGFGYVSFTDTDPVDKVTIMKNHVIDGRTCEVKKAMTKAEMEKIHNMERGGSLVPSDRSDGYGYGSRAGNMDGGYSSMGNMGGMGAGMNMAGASGGNMGYGAATGNMGGGMGSQGMPGMGMGMGMDPVTLAAGYAAYMASMFGGNMMGMGGGSGNMMGNMGGTGAGGNMMGNMGGTGAGGNMMGNMSGGAAAGGNMTAGMGTNMGGTTSSQYGQGNWSEGQETKTDQWTGKARRDAGFTQRGSGPYGAGYGTKQQALPQTAPGVYPAGYSNARPDQPTGEY